jgi:hypothetical protein
MITIDLGLLLTWKLALAYGQILTNPTQVTLRVAANDRHESDGE